MWIKVDTQCVYAWCMHVRVYVCIHHAHTFTMCVFVSVLAEAERVDQKCDRSAANSSGIQKVETLVFAWLQDYTHTCEP